MSDTTRPTSPAPDSHDGEGLAQRLIDQVNALQQRIDKAEQRIRVERALADAQAVDVQAAADEIAFDATHSADADLASAVRRLKRNKPGLFKLPGEGGSGGATNLPAQQPRPEHHLTVLREQARKGDRASLLLYLRARRDKA